MDGRWILVTLLFYQIASGAETEVRAKEGQQVDIKCQPEQPSLIVWFRVLDKAGMEFIASFSSSGFLKTPGRNFSQFFTSTKMTHHTLTLRNFNKERDSGIYTCATLAKGSELRFGMATRLVGDVAIVATRAPPAKNPPSQNLPVTATPCVCKDKKEDGSSIPSMFCAPLILAPLAGGCGLFLLLLIITIIHCNRMRTRRCPHHYKRKKRMMTPEKEMMTNRHF